MVDDRRGRDGRHAELEGHVALEQGAARVGPARQQGDGRAGEQLLQVDP